MQLHAYALDANNTSRIKLQSVLLIEIKESRAFGLDAVHLLGSKPEIVHQWRAL